MDERLFVKVLGGKRGTEPLGTGYLVRKDRVLTARHVIEGEKHLWVEYDPPASAETLKVQAWSLFEGEEPCDIAFLRVKAVKLDVSLPDVARAGLSRLSKWESKGWARTSENRPRVFDSLEDLFGTCARHGPERESVGLSSEIHVKDFEFWEGISGAPVFSVELSRLLGVISTVDPEAETRFTLCPIATAFGDDRVDEIFQGGPSERQRQERNEARRARLVQSLKEVLSEAGKTTIAAVGRVPAWKDHWTAGGASRLIDELRCAADPLGVLRHLDDAHLFLWNREDPPRPSARTIEQVAMLLAPLYILDEYAEKLSAEDGGAHLQLEVATAAMADLVLAGSDGGPALLSPKSGAYSQGETRLPLPSELSIDPKGQDAFLQVVEHFERQKYIKQEVKDKIKATRSEPGGKDRAAIELLGFLNDFFEPEASHGWRRHYFHYKESDAEEYRELLEKLGNELTSVHFLESRGGNLRWETRILKPLENILERAKGETKG